MHPQLKNTLTFVWISAAVFSISLVTPVEVVNSHLSNHEYSDNIKNLNSVHDLNTTTYNEGQPNFELIIEFPEEDFTGDSVSFLEVTEYE